MYKPGPDLYTTDWLSRKIHTEEKDQEITDMNINVSIISTAVNIPVCTSIEDIQTATHEDANCRS